MKLGKWLLILSFVLVACVGSYYTQYQIKKLELASKRIDYKLLQAIVVLEQKVKFLSKKKTYY